MGWRVAAAEKNSIKGVISPDTDLKKTAEPLKTTSADHDTHHAIFTNKTLINAKWIEHTMKKQ